MFSWAFGSTKKREPPVTIDPTPIDDFHVITTPQHPPPNNYNSIYPNLNGSSSSSSSNQHLPYPPSPSNFTSNRTSSPHLRSANSVPDTHNQLDSVPFQLASHLQETRTDLNSRSDWREASNTFRKSKKHIDDGDYEYSFSLERTVLNEERMINGLKTLLH